MKTHVLLLFIGLIPSCGYTLGTRSNATLPFEVKQIAVPLFTNKTFEHDVEVIFTKALRLHLMQIRGVAIVERDQADAVIEGNLRTITLTPIAFPVRADGSVSTTEWRIDVTVDVHLIDNATGEILWDGTGFSDYEVYLAHEEVVMTESNKNRALSQLARRLMGNVQRNMVEGF